MFETAVIGSMYETEKTQCGNSENEHFSNFKTFNFSSVNTDKEIFFIAFIISVDKFFSLNRSLVSSTIKSRHLMFPHQDRVKDIS